MAPTSTLLSRLGTARASLLWFGAVAATLYLASDPILSAAAHSGRSGVDAVSFGLAVDLTVGLTFAWYLLGVRRAGFPPATVLLAFLLSIEGAALLLPSAQHAALDALRLLVVPAELALLAYVATRVRHALAAARAGDRTGDHLEAVLDAAEGVLGRGRAARAVGYEVAVFWYAFASWRAPRGAAAAAGGTSGERFTVHRRAAYGSVVVALGLATLAEVVGVHLLLSRWSPLAAWITSLLGLYGMVWIVGDYRATRLRHVEVTDGTLTLRLGLRWTVRVPTRTVVALRPPTAAERSDPTGTVDARLTLPASPWRVLELSEGAPARGPYGITRMVQRLAVAVDDFDALADALERAALPSASNPTSSEPR